MGIYNEETFFYPDNYWFDLAEKKKKEESSLMPTPLEPETPEPVQKERMADLRADEKFIERAQPFLRYMQEKEGFFDSVARAQEEGNRYKRKKSRVPRTEKDTPTDIIEMLRDEDNKLPTLFSTASALEEAPDDVIRSYAYIRKRFENAEVDSFGEYLSLGKDFAGDIVTDPVNLLGLLAIPFTGGMAAAGRVGAQAVAKKGVQKNIASRLQGLTTPTAVGAIEGGAWSGLEDYGRQTRDIAAKIQDSEVDKTSVAVSTGAGVLVGGTLGYGLGKLGDYLVSKVDKKVIQRAADPNEVETKDVIENDSLIGQLLDREGLEYGKERLGVDDDTADFIEGVFEVIGDEQEVINRVNTFAKKKGLSDNAREELASRLASQEDPITSQGGVANSLSKVINIARQAPAYYGGRVTTFLDPYVSKSDTVKQLQNKFRYDSNRTFFGERTGEGQDYAEVLSDTLGDFYVSMKGAVDPILRATTGRGRDDAFLELSNAVRGRASKDDTINQAASIIRKDLDRAAEQLKDAGLYEDAQLITKNYFPRLWNRKAIQNNQSEFMSLLVKSGEADSEQEALSIISSMLSKNEDYGDAASYGNFFLSKRVFNKIEDDTMFEKFLDNDTQNVLLTYYNQISKQLARKKVFGATKWTDFKSMYEPKVFEELGQAQGRRAMNDLETVWKAQTGEGQEISKFQSVVDGITTAQRLALLPLATVSSLTELLLNFTRGGVYSTVKGFSKAVKDGTQTLTYDMVDSLVKNHNLSRPEAFRKMQRFGIALDQAASDQVERLSGEAVKNPFLAKVNRAFFRANLLEPWTKTVQLTSFNVGRDIIVDNLKAISRHGAKEPNKAIQRKIDELLELNVDIDEGTAWIKKTGGDLDIESPFTYQIDRGAARYANEVILNPTRESGMRSLALSKNPFTTMLFQLTTYPAAFTNTILKDMVRRTTRGMSKADVVGTSKVLGTALTLQAAATQLNYARNAIFTQDPRYEEKEMPEIQMEALARWGGNGLYLDMIQRAARSSEYVGVPQAVMTAPFGPFPGTVLSIAGSRSLAPLASMTPGYGVLPREGKKEVREAFRDILKDEKEEKFLYLKGGEVAIPRAAPEPDERIDKMTGQPYDKQAGTAFMDEEDPIRRLGFGVGGIAKIISKPLSEVIQKYSKRIVSREEAEDAAEEIASRFRGSEDMPGEIDDPDFEDFLKLETKALLEEKHDLTMDQIRRRYPQFIDDKDQLIMGEDFSRARGYTEDEIETFNEASAREQELGDASDIIAELQYILDSKKLTDKRPEPNTQRNLSDVLAQRELAETQETRKEVSDMFKEDYKSQISNLSSEDRALLESMEVPSIPTRPEKVRDIELENRDQALKDFLKDSKEKEPMYRGTKHGYDTDYEMSFAMPQEIGTHVGTRGQATSILSVDSVKELGGGQELSEEVMQSLLADSDMSMPKSITKGYINVTKPLVFEKDFGAWSALEILTRPQDVSYIAKEVAKQSKNKGVTPEVVTAVLKRKTAPYIQKAMDVAAEEAEDSLRYNLHNAKLNIEFRKVLEDFGFDSIKYKNNFEARIKGESPYSYILFKPEQFKSAFAARFDKADPRQNKFKGGKLLYSLKRKKYSKGSITRVGRKVYHDEEGQPYSEKTETIQLEDGRWVNYPTIDKEGKKIPERLFKKLVESQATKGGVVDFITGEVLPTFKDKEEAIEQAVKRSKSLLEE